MKRILSLLIMAVCLFSFCIPVIAADEGFLWGDVDGNGVVNGSDAELLQLAADGYRTLSDSAKSRGDLNGDGKITPTDVGLLYDYLNGKGPIEYSPAPAPTAAPAVVGTPADEPVQEDVVEEEEEAAPPVDEPADDRDEPEERVRDVEAAVEDREEDGEKETEPERISFSKYTIDSLVSEKGSAEISVPSTVDSGVFYATGFSKYLNKLFKNDEFVVKTENYDTNGNLVLGSVQFFDTGFVKDSAPIMGFVLLNKNMNDAMLKQLTKANVIDNVEVFDQPIADSTSVARLKDNKGSLYILRFGDSTYLNVLVLSGQASADGVITDCQFRLVDEIEMPTEVVVAATEIAAPVETTPSEQSHQPNIVLIIVIIALVVLGIGGLIAYLIIFKKIKLSVGKDKKAEPTKAEPTKAHAKKSMKPKPVEVKQTKPRLVKPKSDNSDK